MGDIDLEAMVNMDMQPDINMTKTEGDLQLPEELLEEMQNADVTTITAAAKDMAGFMFDEFVPPVVEKIQGGIGEGIDGIGKGISGVDSGIAEMNSAIGSIDKGRAKLKKGIDGISRGIRGMGEADAGQKQGLAELDKNIGEMRAVIDSGMVPPEKLPEMEGALAGMKAARD